ncbi:MAG: EpsI family protein [Candidatus Eisenbacteria bacterium]|nr:EpsI family protein [Candidatus Eisenbacteria bacterium]
MVTRATSGRRRLWLTWWLPLLFLLPGTFYALAVPPQTAATSNLDAFPATFLGMPSVELSTSEVVLDELRPSDILLRRYNRPDGKPLWLIIIFFQNARLGAHDPRLCYLSQGYHLSEKGDLTVAAPDGTAALDLFAVERGPDRRSVAVWWYVPGAGVTSSQKTFRRLLMLEGFKRHATYGAFVRVSTPAEPDGSEMEILEQFSSGVAELLPSLIEKG